MTVVRESSMEEMEGRLAELQAEIDSYADELAGVKQERDAVLAELSRIRAAYPDVV